jgi:hypothetical protein
MEHDSRIISTPSFCQDDLTSVRLTVFQQLKQKALADGLDRRRLEGCRLPALDNKKMY